MTDPFAQAMLTHQLIEAQEHFLFIMLCSFTIIFLWHIIKPDNHEANKTMAKQVRNTKHIIVEHREQEWTWKQAFLRRIKTPDTILILGVLFSVVLLAGGGLWASTYIATRPVIIGVDGMLDCGAATDGNLQFDGYQVNLTKRNITRNYALADNITAELVRVPDFKQFKLTHLSGNCKASGTINAQMPAYMSFLMMQGMEPEQRIIERTITVDVPAQIYSYGNTGHRLVVLSRDEGSLFTPANTTLLLELNDSNIIMEGVKGFQCSTNVETSHYDETPDGTKGYFYASAIGQHSACTIWGEHITRDGKEVA